MQRGILQVPMSKELKEKAEAVSFDMGFSSLQETIRVLLAKLSKKELSVRIEEVEKVVHLSKAAERRYARITKDIKAGKNIYKPTNKDEFFKLLRA